MPKYFCKFCGKRISDEWIEKVMHRRHIDDKDREVETCSVAHTSALRMRRFRAEKAKKAKGLDSRRNMA